MSSSKVEVATITQSFSSVKATSACLRSDTLKDAWLTKVPYDPKTKRKEPLLATHGLVGSMSRRGNCWDTQSNISPSAAFGLTRAGIGVMPLR